MRETLLETALARLIVKGQEMTVRVLLDSGSQLSYIRKNIAEPLDLQGPSWLLSVTTLGEETSETKRFQRVKFTLSPIKGDSKVEIEALSISKICNPLGPEIFPRGSVQVDVLIGADHYYSFVTGVCKRGSSSETLVAVESCFGWIVTGQVNRQSKHTLSMLKVVENGGVNETLKRFWELESIGIAEIENPVMSQEEERAVADFNRGLNFDEHNYEVRLPWKRDHPRLESNYAQAALRRLESVERKLRQDPVKAKAYKRAIKEYLEKGFAEEVSD